MSSSGFELARATLQGKPCTAKRPKKAAAQNPDPQSVYINSQNIMAEVA